jgi:hypothetical protein
MMLQEDAGSRKSDDTNTGAMTMTVLAKMVTPTVISRDWQMCSSLEGEDRQDHLEVSELEATPETYNKPHRQRLADPRRCVQKYRRSAAGGGSSQERYANIPPRSVVDLHATLCYLLGTLFSTQSPSNHDHDTTSEVRRPPYALASVCNFVDDRVRAIQVEYVTHYMSDMLAVFRKQQRSALQRARYEKSLTLCIDMQLKCIRYHILSQYLLRGAPKANEHGKFECKFNVSALRTAMTHGMDLLKSFCKHQQRQQQELSLKDDNDKQKAAKFLDSQQYHIQCLDEIMSYAALMHLCGVIMTDGRSASEVVQDSSFSSVIPWLVLESGSGLVALEAMWRDVEALTKATTTSSSIRRVNFPRWKWTLKVAAAYDAGNYAQVLRLLQQGMNNITKSCTGSAPSKAEIVPASAVASTSSLMAALGKMTISSPEESSTAPRKNLAVVTPPLSRETSTSVSVNEANDNKSGSDNHDVEDWRWIVLCRCSMLPCVPVLRLLALEQYNKTWMKNEKVSAKNLAHLLHFETSQNTVEFCRMAGLPIIVAAEEGGGAMEDDNNSTLLQFKAAPICTLLTASDLACKARDDTFVLGDHGIRNGPSGMAFLLCDRSNWRTDGDDVVVPSEKLLQFIVQ